MDNLTIIGEADENTITQASTCLNAEEGSWGVLLPDNHLGYSQPIGMHHALRDHISVSGVGYDIGCGNKAVRLEMTEAELAPQISSIMDEIQSQIRFGVGGKATTKTDHPVIDRIAEGPAVQRAMKDKAAEQLGSTGGGNHYVDLFADEDGQVWIGVHFGSRGFGHGTAEHYMAEAKRWAEGQGRPTGGGMMAPPDLLPLNGVGAEYLEAMAIAGEYAYAGRDIVVEQVRAILDNPAITDEVHNHHNYAWQEEHRGEEFWVVRKGCTPAWPDQRGFVGATMGESSVILRGTDQAENAGYSTVHGAGRQMSRTEAAGKTKRRKRWECNARDCDYSHRDLNQFACPRHPDAKPMQRWWSEVKSEGRIDWQATGADLRAKGIELRGGAADEAPGAYKRLSEVLDACGDSIVIEHSLRPLGVAMAGAGVPRDD